MTSVAVTLARWAADLHPSPGDEELAHRSLLDTLAVTLAARMPTRDGDPAQWTWDNAATTLRRYLP